MQQMSEIRNIRPLEHNKVFSLNGVIKLNIKYDEDRAIFKYNIAYEVVYPGEENPSTVYSISYDLPSTEPYKEENMIIELKTFISRLKFKDPVTDLWEVKKELHNAMVSKDNITLEIIIDRLNSKILFEEKEI